MSTVFYVRDFLSKGYNVVESINRAAANAAARGGTVELDAGVYLLEEYSTIDTLSIAHDDGCGDISQKDCHILLRNLHNVTLRGAVNPDGTPATVLAGRNHRIAQELLPSVLWAEGCNRLTIENIAFTRNPECASAGTVQAVEDDAIHVSVEPDLPCYDGMGAYCMNRFDRAQNRLLGASLTWGFGFDTRWQKNGEQTMTLRDKRLAGIIKPGDGLSWHQSGRTDFQAFFGGCDNLRLTNVRVYNTNGFAILTENCKNIMAEKVVIRPRGGQFFCGPRDGWKIYRCSGAISLTNCHIEGVRMDGQNVHSNYLILQEILSDRTGLFACKYAPVPLTSGAQIYFNESRDETAVIADWNVEKRFAQQLQVQAGNGASQVVPGQKNWITIYKISFTAPILHGLKTGLLATASCWTPDSYHCADSVFRNIAGAGQLLRCHNIQIRNCVYTNIMNAGILMGAELDTHCESDHCRNVIVEGCKFENCGFHPRYGAFGCAGIAVKSQGFSGFYNKDIDLRRNVFKSSDIGIELRDCEHVRLEDNKFEAVAQPVYIDEDTVSCLCQ